MVFSFKYYHYVGWVMMVGCNWVSKQKSLNTLKCNYKKKLHQHVLIQLVSHCAGCSPVVRSGASPTNLCFQNKYMYIYKTRIPFYRGLITNSIVNLSVEYQRMIYGTWSKHPLSIHIVQFLAVILSFLMVKMI